MVKTCLCQHKTYAGVHICIAMSVAIPRTPPYYRYILTILTRVSAFSILARPESVVRIPRTHVRFRSSPQKDIRYLQHFKRCLSTACEYIIGLFVSLTMDVKNFSFRCYWHRNLKTPFRGSCKRYGPLHARCTLCYIVKVSTPSTGCLCATPSVKMPRIMQYGYSCRVTTAQQLLTRTWQL